MRSLLISFKVTTDRITCQQLSWSRTRLPWAVSTESKQARVRALKRKLPRPTTIAAQFVLGCWSKKQEINNLCGRHTDDQRDDDLGAATPYDRADRRRRIWAIFASSSGKISMPTPSRRFILRRRSFPRAIKPRNFCRLRRCSRTETSCATSLRASRNKAKEILGMTCQER